MLEVFGFFRRNLNNVYFCKAVLSKNVHLLYLDVGGGWGVGEGGGGAGFYSYHGSKNSIAFWSFGVWGNLANVYFAMVVLSGKYIFGNEAVSRLGRQISFSS